MPLVKPNLPPRSPSSVYQQEQRVPRFTPCSRSTFAAGHADWYHVTSPTTFSDFDICSSCYETTFRNTQYARCISQAPPKPDNVGTRCDLSDRWNRAAVRWLFAQNAPDLTLLGRVAELQSDQDGPCPNLNAEDPVAKKGDKPAATRTWYCFFDTATGSLIEDLTVCSSCIARHNLILPCLNKVFHPVASGAKVEATCDLLTAQNEHDWRRGDLYITKFIETALETISSGTRDTRALSAYLRKWAPIPVCKRAQHIPPGNKSYTFPLSLPTYAACPECHTLHIQPLLASATPPPILLELQPTTHPTGYVCDLYSPRLQAWFKEACTTGDMALYKKRLTERDAKTAEYSRKMGGMQMQVAQYERQEQMYRMQMQTAQSLEASRLLQNSIGSYYYAAPLDFGRSTDAMNQSHQAMMQAEMIKENMELLRKEWSDLYE